MSDTNVTVDDIEAAGTDAAAAIETAATDHADLPGHGGHEEHYTSLGLSNMKLAMWLFLGSECLLFGALISTYLISKARFVTELVAGNPDVIAGISNGENGELVAEMISEASVEPIFDIPFTSLSSFILLMSSLSMVLAHKAVSEGNYKNLRIWLSTTMLMGATFMAGQVYEFTTFFREGLTYDGTVFGTAFYTLTGFHGAHVTGGLIMLGSLIYLSFKDKMQQDRAETVELVGLYWHFVDIVWVLIFTIVYLIP
ncbi:MAG: heme-copper oxidase subunit III [Acidimicrobiales bacterium]|nr:heme-copper oxidase subunit III [Acidimicrobiales bacterium]